MRFLKNIVCRLKGSDEMQYETIILELMTRIKKLEEEVTNLKKEIDVMRSETAAEQATEWEDGNNSGVNEPVVSYGKTTDKMIDFCYVCGKEAYENRRVNMWELADRVAVSTGMNRNSAFMYICAVKSMLEGNVYKRAVNAKAQRKYFNNIYQEYGKQGLSKAIQAARFHAEYRKQCNIPADTVENICREFQNKVI